MLFNYAAILLFTTFLSSDSKYSEASFIVSKQTFSSYHLILQNTSQHHLLYSYPQQTKRDFILSIFNSIHKNCEPQRARLTHINISSQIQLEFGPNIAF